MSRLFILEFKNGKIRFYFFSSIHVCHFQLRKIFEKPEIVQVSFFTILGGKGSDWSITFQRTCKITIQLPNYKLLKSNVNIYIICKIRINLLRLNIWDEILALKC